MENRNLQDNELKNVSGGSEIDNVPTFVVCQNCNVKFDLQCAPFKKDGCSVDYSTVKCPNCGKWVDSDKGLVKGCII